MEKFYRINDLFENSQKSDEHNFFRCWFNNIETTQEEDSYLSALERDLLQIEEVAWPAFLQKCLPLICKFDPKHGWANLWNILNEAKGYVFLKKQGFENIEFLQENKYKTPDIKAWSQNGPVLLEVKNVNRSESDTFWTIFPKLEVIDDSQSIEAFVAKLEKLYLEASTQILEYCQHTGEANKKICLFVIDVDVVCYSKTRSDIKKYINEMQKHSSIEIEYVFIERLCNCFEL